MVFPVSPSERSAVGLREEKRRGQQFIGQRREGEGGKKKDQLLQVLLVVIPRVFNGNNVFSPLFDDE